MIRVISPHFTFQEDSFPHACLELVRIDVGIVLQFLHHPMSELIDAKLHIWIRPNTPGIIWAPGATATVTALVLNLLLLLQLCQLDRAKLLDELVGLHVAATDSNDKVFIDQFERDLPLSELIYVGLDPADGHVNLG